MIDKVNQVWYSIYVRQVKFEGGNKMNKILSQPIKEDIIKCPKGYEIWIKCEIENEHYKLRMFTSRKKDMITRIADMGYLQSWVDNKQIIDSNAIVTTWTDREGIK